MRLVRPESLRQPRESINPRTRRANGRSMEAIVADLNRTLPGRLGYFKHAKAGDLGAGEPDAGDPPVRFEGGSGANPCPVPTSIEFSNELRGDGIDEGAAVVDEDEPPALDAGEAFAGEVGGAGAGFRAEEL